MSNYVLRMEGITKVYDNGIMANNNVNFSVKAGEIHALMGENGAGKTTLMNILFGIHSSSEGEIFLDNEPIKIENPASALNYGIGMVHQHFMLVPSLTVTENLILGNEPKKGIFTDMNTAVKKTEELAKKYNFNLDPKEQVKNLTVGMKQQVEILKALYRKAKILILDEPTAVLAPQETKELFKQFNVLRDQGHTIIFISHKIREVLEICDRVTIMRNGKSIGVHEIKNVTAEDISRMMVGRDVVQTIDKTQADPQNKVLEVNEVSYGLDEEKLLLNKVSFSVRQGEILGIAGVEGNGQRELVEILTGLRESEVGEILLNGEDIQGETIYNLRKRKLAHIPQDRMTYGVAANASIEENLSPMLIYDKRYHKGPLINWGKIREISKKVIKDFLIKCDSPDQLCAMLSGGNMQKVVVARELSDEIADHPYLIVADQPSRGIDVGATRFIYDKLLELRDQSSAVLLISADLNEVMELSDSIIVMHLGAIVAYFSDTKQLTEEILGRYMLGLETQTYDEIRGVTHEKK